MVRFGIASLAYVFSIIFTFKLVDASTDRIVGGTDVPKGSYPWFVKFNGCGGFLISPEFVLTAAHCEPVINGVLTVGALCTGYSNINNCEQKQEVLSIEDYYLHPQFDSNSLDRDFALVKLSSRSTIAPVAIDDGLYSPNYNSETKLWAIGFGVLYYGGTQAPNILQHTQLTYVEKDICENLYGTHLYGISDAMMCAGAYGKDACQGDSGGPLYDKENNVVVGVTSWGVGCGMDHPGVWASIATEYKWILTTMCEKHSYPKPRLCDGFTASPTVSAVPTPNPTISLSPSESPTVMECNSNEMEIHLSLKTDKYGSETGWTIMENSTQAILKSVNDHESQKDYEYAFCVPCSDYIFEITDTYGDGMLAPGEYTLFVNDEVVDSYSLSTDGAYKRRSVDIFQNSQCPREQECAEDEITFDLKHYGTHYDTDLRFAVEDLQTGLLVYDRTDLAAGRLNKVRLCLKCSKYIFKFWSDVNSAAEGGLSIAINGNILEQYNLIQDVGALESPVFTGDYCHIYYSIISERLFEDVYWCMEAEAISEDSLVVVSKCETTSLKQLWRPDTYGQFHTLGNDNLCMGKHELSLRLKPCTNGYAEGRITSISYSYFTGQFIWMWRGRKSIHTPWDLNYDNGLFFRGFDSNTKRQRWRIEEF